MAIGAASPARYPIFTGQFSVTPIRHEHCDADQVGTAAFRRFEPGIDLPGIQVLVQARAHPTPLTSIAFFYGSYIHEGENTRQVSIRIITNAFPDNEPPAESPAVQLPCVATNTPTPQVES
jgi:hypothetical protein